MSTISEEVCKDHRSLAHDYNKILDSPDIDTATRWQNQFIWCLVRHLVAKEQVLFPAFEKHLAERGRFIIDKDRSQYHGVSPNSLLLRFACLSLFLRINTELTRNTDQRSALQIPIPHAQNLRLLHHNRSPHERPNSALHRRRIRRPPSTREGDLQRAEYQISGIVQLEENVCAEQVSCCCS